MTDFAFLHVYSGYSLLQSGLLVEKIVSSTKKRGLSYCALTDFESATGFPELNELTAKAELCPVYGMDLELDGNRLTFIVENEEGYRHLTSLLRLSSMHELTHEALIQRQEGLTVILDAGHSKLRELADDQAAADWLFPFQKGISHFYVGLPYEPEQREFIEGVRSFCFHHSYDLVAFPLVRYEKEDDAIVTLILKAIQEEGTLVERTLRGHEHFISEEDIASYYYESEKAATVKIASSTDFAFSKKRGGLLVFPTPAGYDSKSYLREVIRKALVERGLAGKEEYKARAEYELSVIEKMGYCDYFLIVADYVHFAKTHGISVGPGRGSGGGSLVSYLLDIVTVDPIAYDLLFERFLNPERQSMPDIDVDFSDVRREEVVEYLKNKYGDNRVAHIVTMQTLKARASIRDIGRIYGYEPRQIELLAKAVEFKDETLRNNYRKSAKFRGLVDSDPYYLEIVSLAAKIEGLPRQTGLHAAGIVLNDNPLDGAIPAKWSEEVGFVVDFEMNHLEEQGFLKMDILGLRNLSYIDECLRLIKQRHGIEMDPLSIPYTAPEAIRLIAETKTMGLFQLESPGMNKAIATIGPTEFSDIYAVISLFRPGPMDNIPSYARRKKGIEKVTYISPRLEKILAPTYGIIVYQEQVMQIVRELAGFSYGQADSFRRAISKKDAGKLASLKTDFLAGCQANGVEDRVAQNVFDLIYKFANYGFNKSHALCYAVIACQMAYLKAHYPLEFYCAILGGTAPSDPKFMNLVGEIKSMGISLAVPSINKAENRFLPLNNKLMFPLDGIHGIQSNLCSAIIAERMINGPYADLFDFAVRNKPNGLSQAAFVKLIDAGCFDELDPRRATLRLASSSALRYAEMLSGNDGKQVLLSLGLPKPVMAEVSEDPMLNLLLERENLGLMISGSPLTVKQAEIDRLKLKKLADLPSSYGAIEVAAIVGGVKTVNTKKGTKMAFLTLYDEDRVYEFTMFSEAYDSSYPALKEGNLVRCLCKKDTYKQGGYVAMKVEVL